MQANPGLEQQIEALRRAEAQRFEAEIREVEADGARLAHAVLARARGDERAAQVVARQGSRGRRGLMRLLAASVGIHLLLLGFVTWKANAPSEAPFKTTLTARWAETAESLPVADPLDALEDLAIRDPAAIDRLPESIFALETGREPTADEVAELLAEGAEIAPRFAYPSGMGWAMGRRSNDLLKRRRLVSLGYDASETLEAVERGLGWLAKQQRPDGAWGEGSDQLGRTATALLPFFGEGANSLGVRTQKHGAVVRQGVHWLRSALFSHEEGRPALKLASVQSLEHEDLAAALVALSEDYMLAYGRLGANEGTTRAQEIASLSARVRGAGIQAQGVWSSWALDAADRTGVIAKTGQEQVKTDSVRVALVDAWVESGVAGLTEGKFSAGRALAQGAALLGLERGSKKPRFSDWRAVTTPELLGRMTPSGRARGAAGNVQGRGSATDQTALLVLALQVGYRAY